MRACLLLAVVMLLLLPWLAQAQDVNFPDQGAAYAACRADFASRVSGYPGATPSNLSYNCGSGQPPRCFNNGATTTCWYVCGIDSPNPTGSFQRDCRTGANSNVSTRYVYGGSAVCSARPPLVNYSFQGNLASCHSGCEYAAGIGEPGDTVTVLGSGPSAVTRVSRMSPTGQHCTVGADYQQPEAPVTDRCQRQGNLTQCLTADGRTCAVASSGKKFCWEPSEAGVKLSGNEAAVKSPEGTAIKQPPKAPANGGDWQQGGTGTVSVTSGGVTNNYNTTNYNSTYGSQGSGANGGGADGEGNGGSGEGEGEGNGSASGGGTCTQPYVCSGDPIMCSLGQQMWLSRCGDRKGDANGDGVPDALVGDAPQNPDPGEDVSPTRWGINVGADMLDTENIFGAGSCPLMPSFSIMGVTVAPSEFPQWCTLVAVMRAVVLLMGAFIAISLLMGGS